MKFVYTRGSGIKCEVIEEYYSHIFGKMFLVKIDNKLFTYKYNCLEFK